MATNGSACRTAAQNTILADAATAPALDAFIDDALAARGPRRQGPRPVGFSQAPEAHLCRPAPPQPVAGIIGYSGPSSAPRRWRGTSSKPRVLLVHGDADH